MEDVIFNHLLNQVVDSAEDVIIITEAEPLSPPGPKIIYVNPAFEHLTGYSKEEVIGLTPRILQGKNTSEETKKRISIALQNHQVCHETILNYDKSGKEYWLDMKIVPLFNKNNIITHFAAIERDVTYEKNVEKKLQNLAIEDSLTKILNRRAFFQIAENLFEKYKIDNIPFAILLLDIDDFKKLNDSYGHLIGDQALRWVANSINLQIRKSDIFGRYGGEEFILLLPAVDLADAKKIGLLIKNYLNKNRFTTGKYSILITASIGISLASKNDISLEQIINRADMLLLEAKRSNKNCVMT